MGANEQLKPCPFCDGEAIEVWNRRTNNDR